MKIFVEDVCDGRCGHAVIYRAGAGVAAIGAGGWKVALVVALVILHPQEVAVHGLTFFEEVIEAELFGC